MPRLLIYCDGGFGNRYNTLISGLATAEFLGYQHDVYWPVNNWCEAEYSELFDAHTQIYTSNLIDLKREAGACLVLSHDTINSEYLSVPFISAYGFASEEEFADYCRKDGRDVFFYPALFPPWISPERLINVAKNLPFHPALVAAAKEFINVNFTGYFYGIHLRRTDLVLGYTDSEVGEIVSAHPDQSFFVCSDSDDSEKAAAQYANVRVRAKQSYVERQVEEKGWSDITLDTSNRAYYSNVKRNAQSVRDAVVDLLILSSSTMIGKTGSTFLNVARFIKGFSGNEEGNLPNINTIPIEESFRKAAAGILDLTQLISAAQQLWELRRYDQAVTLLRLWLKYPCSPQTYAVFFNLSVYLEQLGFLHEAESHMRQVLFLQPLFLQGHLQLGLLLEKMGRKEEATAQWLHALSIAHGEAGQAPEIRKALLGNVTRLVKELGCS